VAQLRFEIGRDEFAAISEIPEILATTRPPSEEGLRQLDDLLEIAIPRGKSAGGIEHDHPVAHIIEGDAKLGLTVAQLLKQPCVLDRDHCLIGEGGGKFDLFMREGFDPRAANGEYAEQSVLAQKWNAQQGAIADGLLSFEIAVFRIL